MSIPSFIVNESTSVLNVDTRGLQSGGGSNLAIVYISSTTNSGQFVTIRDESGTLSSPQAILISTTGGAALQPIPAAGIGATSTIVQQRFGYLSLVADSGQPTTWQPVNVAPFPYPDSATATARALNVAQTLTASTVQTTLASTSQLRSQAAEILSTFQGNTYLYISTL